MDINHVSKDLIYMYLQLNKQLHCVYIEKDTFTSNKPCF